MGRTVAGVLLVISLAVVAAGCGSSSKPAVAPSTTPISTTAAGAPGGGTQSAAFEAFRSCLQKAGIDFGFGGRRPNAGTGTTTTPTDTRPRTTTGPPPGGGFGGARANPDPGPAEGVRRLPQQAPGGSPVRRRPARWRTGRRRESRVRPVHEVPRAGTASRSARRPPTRPPSRRRARPARSTGRPSAAGDRRRRPVEVHLYR